MVTTIGFLFPGQGSQYVGMGTKDIEKSQKANDFFGKADEVLGFSLSDILKNGPEDKLKETQITQPALFLASAAALVRLQEQGIESAVAAGHSLGEYSALYAAGALSFEDGIKLVHERGKAMQEAGQAQPGTMAAILGLEGNKVQEICVQVSNNDDICAAANFNSATQVVISGNKSGVEKAMTRCKEAGALKTIPLNVSGAFHSPLMKPAAEKMKTFIDQAEIKTPKIPVITNVDAEATTEPAKIKEKLVQQIDHSVQWNNTMKAIVNKADSFVEVGSGKVLSTLMKKFDRKKSILWTDDFEAIEKKFSSQVSSPN